MHKKIREKLTHAGIQRYTKNLGWMFFARFGTMAIGFAATAYIARNLGPTSFGELSYATSFVALFGIFATLGIDQTLTRELLLSPTRRASIMGTALVLRFISGLFAMLAIIGIAYFFSPHDVSLILIAIISTTLVFSTLTLIGQEFQSIVESKWPSIQSIVVVGILNIAKIIVIALDGGVIYLAGVMVLEPILYGVGFLYLRHRRFGSLHALSFDTQIARIIFIDALPLTFVAGFATIYSRIDQIFIKNMLGAASVGLYDAAVRLSEVWYFLPGIIIGGLIPAIANAKRTNEIVYWKRTRKLFLFILGVTVLLAIFTTTFAHIAVSLAFGQSFIAAAPILMIYIWSNIGAALVMVTQQILLLERLSKYILFTTFSGMVTNVGLCILLIPVYGMYGAALASLIAYIIPFLSLFFFRKTRTLFISILTS